MNDIVMPTTLPKLTFRQRKFVEETIKTLNPTEAVRRTYNLGSKGGSKTEAQKTRVANSIAMENLEKPAIKMAFKEKLKTLDLAKYLNRLDEIAMSDDKRAALQAMDQIFTLSDSKPAGKLKINEYNEELESLRKE